MRVRLTLALLVAGLALLVHVLPAAADGWIIPMPPPDCRNCPPPQDIPYLGVKYHRVSVTIADQVATTRIDQVFVNPAGYSLEGTYIFPLPEEAAIGEFTMWIDGEPVQGELHTREEARRVYEDIVRRRIDPALLEYVGRDLFQASIFPIGPGEERRIEIEYSQVLPAESGLVRYVYPLSTERFSSQPLEDVSIGIEISSRVPIKSVYSSSHSLSVQRDGDRRVVAGWEDSDVIPNTDFTLYYTVSPDDLAANLLSYKQADDDGFFALLIAPNVEAVATEVVAKDVIVVLDTSGSMEGGKIDQAKAALRYVLSHLNDEDRFNVIAFSTGWRSFSRELEPVSAGDEAIEFVRRLRAEGSTDINGALLEALAGVDEERPTIIIFLTDGLPTQGVTDASLIIENVRRDAPKSVRLFSFGVGDDVDTVLLDTLSRELRGASAYVRPGERVDEQVSAFYAKVSTPVLADVTLAVDGVVIEDIYPHPLPDLFAGGQLVVVGRYREGGPATVTLSGEVNGRARTFTYDDVTFRDRGGDDFIPRLWATRKIGYLLNEIRLRGENAEMVDQIVKLSIRYGIITPYTSFLVEEPEEALTVEGRERLAARELEAIAEAPAAPASGAEAVTRSVEQDTLQKAEVAAPAAPADAGAGRPSQGAVVTVADKAFVLVDGVWTDTTFDATHMRTTKVRALSDEFFRLLRRHPDTGRYFAVGERAIVVLEGRAYEAVPAGDEVSAAAAASNAARAVLSADPQIGRVPLTVAFAGDLVGGADDDVAYYCVPITWEFGDGTMGAIVPDCAPPGDDVRIDRRFSITHVYEQPGTYQARFAVGDTWSEPITIEVRPERGHTLDPDLQQFILWLWGLIQQFSGG